MNVGLAKPADLDRIFALEDAFPETDRWTRQMWAGELGWPDRRVVTVGTGELLVGVATFQRLGDVVDLHRIVVAASHRRGGLAGSLLDDGIGWARGVGAERILLEVATDNLPALAFYRAHDFERIAERRDYYGPGRDALVLELSLTKEPL